MSLRHSTTLQTPIQQSAKTSTDQCHQKPTLIRQYQMSLSVAVGQRLSETCEMALKYSGMYGFSIDLFIAIANTANNIGKEIK